MSWVDVMFAVTVWIFFLVLFLLFVNWRKRPPPKNRHRKG